LKNNWEKQVEPSSFFLTFQDSAIQIMDKYIVVMGVAGCGKSSLGAALAQAEGLPLVEGDDFHSPANRAKMSQGIALTDADRDGWLDILGEQLQAHPGGMVLTCSALKRRYRDRLRQARPGLRFVFLDIDGVMAVGRVRERGVALRLWQRHSGQRRAVAPAVRVDGVHWAPPPPTRRASTWPSPAWRACWPAKPLAFKLLTAVIRVLVMAACAMLAWGAWQQVVVGMDSHSVVLGYPVALLPLPALLCAVAIGRDGPGRTGARQAAGPGPRRGSGMMLNDA
jgi:hypothetical protein